MGLALAIVSPAILYALLANMSGRRAFIIGEVSHLRG